MVKKIVAGGQTGADRAALDAAIKFDIPHGGRCPKGRKAEDGIIHERYNLQETITEEYSERTKLNIHESDGTLIIVLKTPIDVKDGTILTIEEVKEKNKPYFIVDLSNKPTCEELFNWINENEIETLNIAGPRESQSKGIYKESSEFLENFFQYLLNQENCIKDEVSEAPRMRR